MPQTNLAQLAITNPLYWTKEELYTNLQAAVDVELWTIPLYLTALYSMQGLDSGHQSDYPTTAKLIESVVIEEMLHLQLACNICNALGYTPQLSYPTYDAATGIPFLKAGPIPAKYQGYQVRLGGLDANQLKLFCVVELPEPATQPDWTAQTRYNSIGELYQALEIAVKQQWDALYVGDAQNTRQQANFTDFLLKFNQGNGFSQVVNSLDTALAAMGAIVEQGEGNDNGGEVPAQDQAPQESGTTDATGYDPSDYDPTASHFLKFDLALDLLLSGEAVPLTYPVLPNPSVTQMTAQATAQANLAAGFASFIELLQFSFSQPQPKNQLAPGTYPAMFNLQQLIAAVWQSGAVPAFPRQ